MQEPELQVTEEELSDDQQDDQRLNDYLQSLTPEQREMFLRRAANIIKDSNKTEADRVRKAKIKAKRRKANKVARASRKVNRQKAKKK